jgi:hypothetical protein
MNDSIEYAREALLAQSAAYPGLAVSFGVFFLVLVVSIVVLGFVNWYRTKKARRKQFIHALSMVVLEVRLPKRLTDKDEDAGKQEKDLIAVAEQFYTNLSGINRRNEYVVLEMVSVLREISFFVTVPRRLHGFIEKQIHAQYPKASVEEVAGHNIFWPDSKVSIGRMELRKSDSLPVKTYKVLESDPLNALASALSKLDKYESAAIQLVVRPAKPAWAGKGTKIAREMQQGKSLSDVTKSGTAKVVEGVFTGLGDAISSLFTPHKDPQEREREQMDDKRDDQKRLTAFEEEMVKAIEDKSSRSGFDTQIRLLVVSSDQSQADLHLANIANSFAQYNSSELNSFTFVRPRSSRAKDTFINNYILKRFVAANAYVLNTEELVSVFHFPTKFTDIPNLKRLEAKTAPAPSDLPEEGILLGENVYRGVKRQVRMGVDDRRRHMYVIGKTGVGKTTIMKNMAAADILNGQGVCVVDPHGDFIEDMLRIIPKERAEDVVLFDPGDTERPLGLNMLEYKTPEQKDFVVDEMIAIFHKLFPPEIVGPMFEHNMRNVMLTLMADVEQPGTIAEIPRMFTDKKFQEMKIAKVTDPVVRDFWEKEMAQTSDFHKSEMLGYLVSKVGQFVENSMMRNIIGQQRSAFDVREVMDSGKILLVNLSKGKTGEINSALLGLIMVSKIQMAAMGRANMPEDERRDFYLYIDEFQNFVTDSIATILSEARKYHLNLVMAHQYISQLEREGDTKVRNAVFGNVGSMISFKVGATDAEFLEREFEPVFDQFDLINVERYHAYAKIMVNGQTSRPFSMRMFDFNEMYQQDAERAVAIRRLSRFSYGRDAKVVETDIFGRGRESAGQELGPVPPRSDNDGAADEKPLT